MASPSPRSVLGTASGTVDATSFTLPFGTHDVGDTLFAIVLADAIPVVSCTGWTNIVAVNAAGSQAKLIFFRRDTVAASDSETNPTFISDSAQQFAGYALAIPGTALLNAEGTGTNGSSTTPDAPNFSPSAGSQDYLWIAIAGTDNGSGNTFSGWPTGYSTGDYVANGAGAGVTLAIGTKESTASSDDPSAFTAALNEQWAGVTVAIWETPPAPAPAKGGSLMMMGI